MFTFLASIAGAKPPTRYLGGAKSACRYAQYRKKSGNSRLWRLRKTQPTARLSLKQEAFFWATFNNAYCNFFFLVV